MHGNYFGTFVFVGMNRSEKTVLVKNLVDKAFEVIDMKTLLVQRAVNADEINQEMVMRLDVSRK